MVSICNSCTKEINKPLQFWIFSLVPNIIQSAAKRESLFRFRKPGTEKLGNLPDITQLVNIEQKLFTRQYDSKANVFESML